MLSGFFRVAVLATVLTFINSLVFATSVRAEIQVVDGFPAPALNFVGTTTIGDEFDDGVLGFPWIGGLFNSEGITVTEQNGVLLLDTGLIPIGAPTTQAGVVSVSIPHTGSYSAELVGRFLPGSEGLHQVVLMIGTLGSFGIPEQLTTVGQVLIQTGGTATILGISACDLELESITEECGEIEIVSPAPSLINELLTLQMSYDALTSTLIATISGLPGEPSSRSFSLANVPALENPVLTFFAQGSTDVTGISARAIFEVERVSSTFSVAQYFLANSPLQLDGVPYFNTLDGNTGILYGHDLSTQPQSISGQGGDVVVDGDTSLNVILVNDTASNQRFTLVTAADITQAQTSLPPQFCRR